MENIDKIGNEDEQWKVFIDPNKINETEPKTKEQLLKEFEEKNNNFC